MVDVVIPTYSRRELTIEAVASVLRQSYAKFSLFIIEDGSDNLSKADFSDERIFYHRLEKNQGPSYCRNYGASLGKSKYIAFLDSDDLWHSDKLKLQVQDLEERSLKWAHTNEAWFRYGVEIKQKRIHKKQGGFLGSRMFKRCLISPSTVIFNRFFWESQEQFLEHFRVAEDYELWMRLNLEKPIGYLEDALTIKRAGTWQQLSTTPLIDHYRILSLHRLLRNNAQQLREKDLYEACLKEALEKLDRVILGAQKHLNPRLNKYLGWKKVLERKQTLP